MFLVLCHTVSVIEIHALYQQRECKYIVPGTTGKDVCEQFDKGAVPEHLQSIWYGDSARKAKYDGIQTNVPF
jgi:hypothetical protein